MSQFIFIWSLIHLPEYRKGYFFESNRKFPIFLILSKASKEFDPENDSVAFIPCLIIKYA